MIARSDDELELFEKIDLERRREEAELGAERKPRLIEESELPEFLCQNDEDLEMQEEEDQQKELDLGRGNRARKDVTYQEQLSERDWLKAIGAEEEDSDEGVPSGLQEDTPKRKKSKKR